MGDEEIELGGGTGRERGAEVEGGEGPIEVGELLCELHGELALHGGG